MDKMDIAKVLGCLPHRYPMLMVDRVVDMSPQRIVAIKNVTYNEGFFQVHFPGAPVMPGVLQLEAMAQVGHPDLCDLRTSRGIGVFHVG